MFLTAAKSYFSNKFPATSNRAKFLWEYFRLSHVHVEYCGVLECKRNFFCRPFFSNHASVLTHDFNSMLSSIYLPLFVLLLLSVSVRLSETRCTADSTCCWTDYSPMNIYSNIEWIGWPTGSVSYQMVDSSLLWFINSKFPEKTMPDAAVSINRPYLYTVAAVSRSCYA